MSPSEIPPVEAIDPLDALRLLGELTCHSSLRCVHCYVPEADWHQAVCLSPHELSILRHLLTGPQATGRKEGGGETRARRRATDRAPGSGSGPARGSHRERTASRASRFPLEKGHAQLRGLSQNRS